MLLDTLSVCRFLDPDCEVKILFKKEEATEKGGVDFEIEDRDTSAHLYWV